MKTYLQLYNPWIIGIYGLIMFIFGIAAIIYSELTLSVITRFFGILLLLNGVFYVILTKFKSTDIPDYWSYEGLVHIVIGLLFILIPTLVANIFVILIGLLSLIIGIKNIWFLTKNKPEFMKLTLLRNLILVVLGMLLIFVPIKSAVVIINIIGLLAFIYGAVTLFTAYKLFELKKEQY
jgi:uncharacterized membrane protein HdeD (DUF308 family)